MKEVYKDCDIEVGRDECNFLVFSIFENGYEVTSGFSESHDSVKSYFDYMKTIVDDYKEHPENYK